MKNTVFLALLVVVIAIGTMILFRSNQANASENHQVVQKMLIQLTANMKSYSEKSEVSFKYWADLNDALLGHFTNYYNRDSSARFESTKDMIAEAESRLNEISSIADKSKQQDLLEMYISELEADKSNQ